MDIDPSTIEFIIDRTIAESISCFITGTIVGFVYRAGKESNNFQAGVSGLITIGNDFFEYFVFSRPFKESSAGDVGSFLGFYLGLKVGGYFRGNKYSEEKNKKIN